MQRQGDRWRLIPEAIPPDLRAALAALQDLTDLGPSPTPGLARRAADNAARENPAQYSARLIGAGVFGPAAGRPDANPGQTLTLPFGAAPRCPFDGPGHQAV